MNNGARTQEVKAEQAPQAARGTMQRTCACGQHAVGGECEECARKRVDTVQRRTLDAGNDPLEREANLVADRVVAAQTSVTASSAPPRIQRQADRSSGSAEAVPVDVDRTLAAPGKPLDSPLRQTMERRFGQDFSRVRVHTDADAARSARGVNAQAYTLGQDIVFGAGHFAPATRAGQHLLAHELTHVVQQSAGTPAGLQRQPEVASDAAMETETGDSEVDDPMDDYETGADNEIAPEEIAVADLLGSESVAADAEPEGRVKPPTSGKWILVKLPGTLMRFEGNKLISSWGISGGKKGHPTPTGRFSINSRDQDHRSSSYGTCGTRKVGPGGARKCKKGETYTGADMKYFQQFAPAVGFHRGDPAVQSHGCIHVSGGNAKTLWEWAATGTPVIVCTGADCNKYIPTDQEKPKK